MSYSDNPFIPQMLSPTSYEIGRYGRTPASHFYGLPNISIPLTEVRAKGYSLPVSLSYHAGGHKPEVRTIHNHRPSGRKVSSHQSLRIL